MTEIEVVLDIGTFVDHEPRSSFAAVLNDTALVHGEGNVTPCADVHEVAQLGDAYVQSAFSSLHEIGLLDDLSFPSVFYDAVTRDTFFVSDAYNYKVDVFQLVLDAALLHGEALANPSTTAHEIALLSDRITWFGTGTKALHEIAKLSDAAFPSNAARVHEIGELGDAISDRLIQIVSLRDTALLNDSVVATFVPIAILHDVFFGTDHAYPISHRRPVLHDTFYGDDWATPPPFGRAYTCSILVWGMSVYQNYPFLTQAANYAAGQNLWRLDALDDYGTPTSAWITTGKVDTGSAHGKRPVALYAAGSSSEPLGIVVTGDVNGVLSSYNYTMDLRDQTDYRNNKAFLGKGFRSRYLQFTLQAPKYLGFRLLTAEVDLATSPRRVG